jgi:hypothetical protein
MIAAILPVVVGRPVGARVVRPASAHPPDASVLDRRGGPRDGSTIVDRFTAAMHRPLPLVFAVGARGHWAVMTGVSCSPHGILLRALDPHEAALEAPELDVVAAWRRMASIIGTRGSPLWYSSAAIAAADFVGELATAGACGPVAIELVVLDDGPLRGHSFAGVLAPLSDPTPAVLGVLLGPTQRDALAAACGAGPARPQAAAISPPMAPPHDEAIDLDPDLVAVPLRDAAASPTRASGPTAVPPHVPCPAGPPQPTNQPTTQAATQPTTRQPRRPGRRRRR